MARRVDDLIDALSPLLGAHGLDLVDIELRGAELTVYVDRDSGVDLDTLGSVSRVVSAALDTLDPLPGRYTLSVSSPGLERRLRTPAHFARAVGEKVTVRVHAGTADVHRIKGTIDAVDADGFTLTGSELPDGPRHVAYGDVERARTVFTWGPESKRVSRQ